MARRKSKLNFVDSLFGGLARGFQFSQGIQNRNRRLDQFDRQLDFSEDTLDINRQELDLKMQKLKQAQELQESIQKLIQGSVGTGGQTSSTAGITQQPSVLDNIAAPSAGAPQTFEPIARGGAVQQTPSAPQSDPFISLPEQVSDTNTAIVSQLAQQQQVDPASGIPSAPIPVSPEPFFQDTAGLQEADVGPPPLSQVSGPKTDQLKAEIKRKSINRLKTDLEAILASPDTSRTVSLSSGGQTVTIPTGKKQTGDQLFTTFNRQVRKAFPGTTDAEVAQALQDSPLRDTKAASTFLNRTFNSAVVRAAQEQGTAGERLTKTERNKRLQTAVNQTVQDHGGFVSKRHEKQFQEQTIDNFSPSVAMEREMLRLGIKDSTQLREMIETNPAEVAAMIDKAQVAINNLQSSETSFRVTTDGRVFATTHQRDRNGNEIFDTTELFVGKGLDFTPRRIVTQSAQEKANVKAVDSATETIQGVDDIHATINALAKLTKNEDGSPISEEKLNASLGFAGGFNKFTTTLFDQMRGLADSSTLPGSAGIAQIVGKFRESEFFNKTISAQGEQMQRFAIGYITLILKTAKMIGLGEARAISDKDFDRVQSAISASGSTTLRATLSFLNEQANTTRKRAVDIRTNPNQALGPRDPNPDPFGPDAADPQQRSFLTPNFFASEAPAQEGQREEPKNKEEALKRIDELLEE